MFLAKISINRPIMITMFIMIFIVFGIIGYFTLPLNLMPVIEMPFVTVQTIYPGAGPQEVETQITKKIEDAVSTISRIDYVESYSMENNSFVIIRFQLGKDVNIANQEVKDKVGAIERDFPDDAEKPSISKYDITEEPIMYLIYSDNKDLVQLYDFADKKLRDRLAQVEGVANVDIYGGQEREIHVEFPDRVVYQNIISLPQVAQIIGKNNLDMPAGNFDEKDQEYTVRMDGEYTRIKELEDLDIPTYFGEKKLGHIAQVKDSGSKIRQRTIYYDNIEKFQDDNLVGISIVKSSDGNPVEISQNIKKELTSIKQEIPAGTELKILEDDSEFIKSAVNDTLSNVILGVIFTGLILLFFLHDLRSTLIVALAMPTSIISTFLLMNIAGFSLNILSLMGLSTSVGILVTNSVVVLENIFRHKQKGHKRKSSADKGTAEVAVAVIAATLTNIVVFLPLATMHTIAGKFLIEFAVTVVFATIFSLLISFTLTPMLSSIILPEKPKRHPLGDKMERMFKNWEKWYKRMVGSILKTRSRAVATIIFSFLLFFATLIFITPKLGFEFLTSMDQGKINIEFDLPQGYSLKETYKVCDKIQDMIISHKEVMYVLTEIGSQGWVDKGSNLGDMNVKLVDIDKRDISSQEMVNILTEELADVPNIKIRVSKGGSIAGAGADIEFFLMGQQMEVLEKYKDIIIQKAKRIRGLMNFVANYRKGKPEITLKPQREKIAEVGSSIYEIAMTLRASIEGIKASVYRDKGNEYDIKVSLTDNSVDTENKIKNLPVITKSGIFRISQLTDLDFTKGTNRITHREKFKTIPFTGSVGQGYAQSDIVNQIKKIVKEIDLPAGYKISWGGESEMMQENNREMGKAFLLAILLTYMLLAAILESFTKPFLILTTLPLALIGVLLALFFAGQTFNLVSMMGIIMLIGIVVNAAILLLDYTEQLRKKGKNRKEALLEACPTKLRPIVMSVLAIILGMLPMAVGIGSSAAELRQSLGIVSIGGLIVSTFLTLFVIPAFYYLTTYD